MVFADVSLSLTLCGLHLLKGGEEEVQNFPAVTLLLLPLKRLTGGV